jgi:hypothetical protein
MKIKDPLTPEILLDVIQLTDVMVSPEGLSDLKSNLRDLGWEGVTYSIDVNIEDLRSSAQDLIDSGKATMDKKGWLQIVDNIQEQDEISARDILLGIISEFPEYYQTDDQTESDFDLASTIEKIVHRMHRDASAKMRKLNAELDELQDIIDEEFFFENHQ